MKKKTLNAKLSLTKQTVSVLNNDKLQSVKGGQIKTYDCQISYDFGVCISINVAC